MTAHANRRPHARTTDSSDSDDDHHKGNMQDLRRPCPKEHLGHAGKIRLPKPEPRPKLLSTPSSLPNRKQRPRDGRLSKLRGEDAANHAAKMPQPTRRRCRHPLVSRLWPAPRRCPQGGRRREGAFIARSRRSEVSLRRQGRGEGGRSTAQQQRFQEKARRPRTSPSPDLAKAGHRISPGDAQPPPACTCSANKPHPAEVDPALAVGSPDPPHPGARTTP